MSIRPDPIPGGAGLRRPAAAPAEDQLRLRPQDILRGLLIGGLVLAIGLVLGNFTFSEVSGRGTPYFVLAAGLGIVLAAVTYRKLELAMMAYLVVAWAAVGGTPDVATGTGSGVGRALPLSLMGIAFLLFFWVLRGLMGRGFSFVRSPLNGLLAAYLAFNALCAVNGRLFWDPPGGRLLRARPGGGADAPAGRRLRAGDPAALRRRVLAVRQQPRQPGVAAAGLPAADDPRRGVPGRATWSRCPWPSART